MVGKVRQLTRLGLGQFIVVVDEGLWSRFGCHFVAAGVGTVTVSQF